MGATLSRQALLECGSRAEPKKGKTIPWKRKKKQAQIPYNCPSVDYLCQVSTCTCRKLASLCTCHSNKKPRCLIWIKPWCVAVWFAWRPGVPLLWRFVGGEPWEGMVVFYYSFSLVKQEERAHSELSYDSLQLTSIFTRTRVCVCVFEFVLMSLEPLATRSRVVDYLTAPPLTVNM